MNPYRKSRNAPKFILMVGDEQLVTKSDYLKAAELHMFLDYASSFSEARGMVRHGTRTYSLIVLDARKDHLAALQFCQDLRRHGLKVACVGLPEEARESCPNPIPATMGFLDRIKETLLA